LKMFFFCLIFAISAALPSTGLAATYYLDAANGNDSNPGTGNEPWKTIGKAFNAAAYGDTVLLRNGNYGVINNPISFPVYTGSMTEPLPEDTEFITFKADSGHTPVFTGLRLGYITGSSYYTPYVFEEITVTGSSGVDFDNCVGVRLKNCTITGTSPGSGVGIGIEDKYFSNDIQILNCNVSVFLQAIRPQCNNLVIKENNIYGIGADYLQMSTGINVLIEGNNLYGPNKVDGAHMDYLALSGEITNLTVRGNYFRDSQSQSIFCHGYKGPWTNVLIENNLIYNNKSLEVQIQNMHNLVYRNNTVIGNGGVISQALRIQPDCSNVSVYNNIFITDSYGSGSALPGSFADHDYNIYIAGSDTGAAEPRSYAYSSMSAALADLFLDSDNNDFRLKAGDRAINFGTSQWGVPATDILGNPRDAQPDAGCFEYMSGPVDTTAPSIPQNLTAQAVSESQIDLSWNASSDPESGINYYKIYSVLKYRSQYRDNILL
ncbi:MAG: right-handed parallel beta-helix repeat-containing protein, partial [Planctomycetota bacterium]